MKVLTAVKKKKKKANPQHVSERGGRIKGIELEISKMIF